MSLVRQRKPDTVLLYLRPVLLTAGGPDPKSDGYLQLVPMAGQGAAAQQLLTLGFKSISCFPPQSATWSASPLPVEQNIMFTVMFITAVHVFWTFLLHRNIVVYAGVWTPHLPNEFNLSTPFLGRYFVIGFLKQKTSALQLSGLLRCKLVYGTAARGNSRALRGQGLCCVIRAPWPPTAPAPVPRGSAPCCLCLRASIGPFRCTRTGFALALFCQLNVTATEKMHKEDFPACHPSRKKE